MTPSSLDLPRVALRQLARSTGRFDELAADDDGTDTFELFEDLVVGQRPGAQADERRVDQLARHPAVGEVRDDRQVGADELVRRGASA